jgi:hypothetical protein
VHEVEHDARLLAGGQADAAQRAAQDAAVSSGHRDGDVEGRHLSRP